MVRYLGWPLIVFRNEGGEIMEIAREVLEAMDQEIFAVWFLIGAAFVFWMQAGFAMCEAGFTRAKNAGNIIMKNLMDFCIGTVMWFICGASLMLGENILHGFIGGFSFDVFTNYGNFDYSASCSTWYSVPRRRRSCPVPWQSGRNFPATVYTRQSSPR